MSNLQRMPWWLYRLYVRWRMWCNSARDLNTRVEVENVLLSVASGKREQLSKEECSALAYKLGMSSR